MVDIAALLSLDNPQHNRHSLSTINVRTAAGKSQHDTSLFLMPSQVHRRLNTKRSHRQGQPPRKQQQQQQQQCASLQTFPSTTSFIIPSQVLAAHPTTIGTPTLPNERSSSSSSNINNEKTSNKNNHRTSCLANDNVPPEELLPPMNKRSRRRNRTTKRGTNTNTTFAKRKRFPPTGDLPDVHWRSIPMEHLRYHPNFVPLPPPESISRLQSLEDVRQFRQESWQWDALHPGRCTTSQAVAALGFLEPLAAEFLGVPRGWRHGGQGAYHRLIKPALRTLEEMNTVLVCDKDKSGLDEEKDDVPYLAREDAATAVPRNASVSDNTYWTTPQKFPFAAKYTVALTEEVLQQRQHQAKVYTQSPGIQWSIRMLWGNVQEATALLTALNYFWKLDRRIVLKEVGMCGAGLALNNDSTGLLVGATPDALLVYPDGTVEAVEVKNHCPFLPNTHRPSGDKRSNRVKGKFRVGRLEFSHGVMPQYVPQVMMEMLCVGKECKSAIVVRQSALNGALILRIHRDDQWIDEMVYWLQRFHEEYVQRNDPPPPNFFYENDNDVDRSRYHAFLEFTKRLESKVETLAHVPNDEVQRAVGTFPGATNLFLDSLPKRVLR